MEWSEREGGAWQLAGLPFGMVGRFARGEMGLLEAVLVDADGKELARQHMHGEADARQGLYRMAEVALESLIMTAQQGVRQVLAARGPDVERQAFEKVKIHGADWLIERWPDQTCLYDDGMDSRWEVPGFLSTEQVLAVEQLREMARAIGDMCGRAQLRTELRQLLGAAAEAVR